ncbi:MAG TPA: AAA family ATPase, partial [Solirubrobacteraceae bacterium]
MSAREHHEIPLRLDTGLEISGSGPVVVIGPNGSGKTRQSRNLQADVPIEFVNALRNTRVAPDLPAMGMETARNQYRNTRDQAKTQHWELTSEFDSMLSNLLGEDAMAEKDFVRRYRENPATVGEPPQTPLSRVESVWREIFTGRELRWRDWKPLIHSTTTGQLLEYSGHQMSDGEKAALFVSARVFSADPGVVLVVDEPETHFHSLLAVRLWNALEDARPDIRFVYVTHDLTFALSCREARYVIASPTAGLRLIDIDDDLPSDVAEALLGAASLSFYASRVVF